MTEKKDYYATAKKQMRLSERILAALPGFKGYKEKELRRESDRLLRDHLYRKLSDAKKDARDISRKLSDNRSFNVLTEMDRVVAKFDRIAEKVNHASYGYAGFFDVVKIKEENLDRMIAFDNDLADDVAKIAEETAALKADIRKEKFDKAGEGVQSLNDSLEAFEETFDKREEEILGVE